MTQQTPYAVEVRNLVARYGSEEILSGVDMRVAPGEIRVILGGSGSGKSTLLKHIIGLHAPASGTVCLLGTDLYAADEPVREGLMRRIGMLFQNGALLNALTVHENIALPINERCALPAKVVDEMVRMKLALVGLSHAAHLSPRELSGGMAKRAALARAMALDPEVLFCDEPSAGLDPITAAELDQLILGLRDQFGMAIIVVTHELESIKTIADTITMLGGGKVLADGPLAEVRALSHAQQPDVHAFFARQARPQEQARMSLLRALGDETHGGKTQGDQTPGDTTLREDGMKPGEMEQRESGEGEMGEGERPCS